MTKRLIAIVLLVALVGCMLAACGAKITADEAKQIVLTDLGATEDKASCHVHESQFGGEAAFLVYVTYEGEELAYAIAVNSGKILYKGHQSHSH